MLTTLSSTQFVTMTAYDSITSVGGHLFASVSFGASAPLALIAGASCESALDALKTEDMMTARLEGGVYAFTSFGDDVLHTLAEPVKTSSVRNYPTMSFAVFPTPTATQVCTSLSTPVLHKTGSVTSFCGHLFASASFTTSFGPSSSLADIAIADAWPRSRGAVALKKPTIVNSLPAATSLCASICNFTLGVPATLPRTWRCSTPALKRSPASRRSPVTSRRYTPPSTRSALSTPALSISSSSCASTPLSLTPELVDASVCFQRVSGMRMSPVDAWNALFEDGCDAVLDAFYAAPASLADPAASAPMTMNAASSRKRVLGACRRAISRFNLAHWNNVPVSTFA